MDEFIHWAKISHWQFSKDLPGVIHKYKIIKTCTVTHRCKTSPSIHLTMLAEDDTGSPHMVAALEAGDLQVRLWLVLLVLANRLLSQGLVSKTSFIRCRFSLNLAQFD